MGDAIVGGPIAPPCFVRKGDTFTINAGTIVLPWDGMRERQGEAPYIGAHAYR